MAAAAPMLPVGAASLGLGSRAQVLFEGPDGGLFAGTVVASHADRSFDVVFDADGQKATVAPGKHRYAELQPQAAAPSRSLAQAAELPFSPLASPLHPTQPSLITLQPAQGWETCVAEPIAVHASGSGGSFALGRSHFENDKNISKKHCVLTPVPGRLLRLEATASYDVIVVGTFGTRDACDPKSEAFRRLKRGESVDLFHGDRIFLAVKPAWKAAAPPPPASCKHAFTVCVPEVAAPSAEASPAPLAPVAPQLAEDHATEPQQDDTEPQEEDDEPPAAAAATKKRPCEFVGALKTDDELPAAAAAAVDTKKRLRDDEPAAESVGADYVEAILAHKWGLSGGRKTKMFKVRWEGSGPEEDTWEPEANLDGSPELLADYLSKQQPAKAAERKRQREEEQEKEEEEQEKEEQEEFDPPGVGDLVDVDRRLSREGGTCKVTSVSDDGQTFGIKPICGGGLEKVSLEAIMRVVDRKSVSVSGSEHMLVPKEVGVAAVAETVWKELSDDGPNKQVLGNPHDEFSVAGIYFALRPAPAVPGQGKITQPAGLCVTLRDYQLRALQWMLEREKNGGDVRGGILAEEMGLGKTIEVAALMLAAPAPPPHCKCNLIITPRAISRQWETELREKAGGLNVLVYEGCRDRDVTPPSLKQFGQFDVVLTT